MQKKAILLPEVLKLVIAALCISLLIILAFSLQGIFIKKHASEQAKESIKTLYSEIQKVESGEKVSSKLFIESPVKWWVIAWPYKDEENKPISCKKDYCICLCPIPSFPSKDESLKECNSVGVCRDVSKPIKTVYKAKPTNNYADIIKKFIGVLGYDTENVPINIEGILPLNVSIEGETISVTKEK